MNGLMVIFDNPQTLPSCCFVFLWSRFFLCFFFFLPMMKRDFSDFGSFGLSEASVLLHNVTNTHVIN